MDKLQEFYVDEAMRDVVNLYLKSKLADMATKRAFAGESTVGIKEAAEAIDQAFGDLDGQFKPQAEKHVINQAR